MLPKRTVRVGMIGSGQIARAHALAYGAVPLLYGLGAPRPVNVIVAEADFNLAHNAGASLGFESNTDHWADLTRSENVDLVDIITPTFLHKEPAIDAVRHGKHVLCEKPLATTAADAKEMYEAARDAGVVNAVGFNYRKLPAVTFARNLVAEGFTGQIYNFRANFLEDWGATDMPLTWRFQKDRAGAGALGDLGSHAIDLARFLVGEISSVCGTQETFKKERTVLSGSMQPRSAVDVDDTTMALLKFAGASTLGSLSASWSSRGRKVFLEFELSGSDGSIYFNLERPNELQIFSGRDDTDKQGYRTVLMGPRHPFGSASVFPAPGAGMGYEDSLVAEIYEVMKAVVSDEKVNVEPSFFDGWKACEIVEAIQDSAESGSWKTL